MVIPGECRGSFDGGVPIPAFVYGIYAIFGVDPSAPPVFFDAPAFTALPFLSPLAAEPPAWHGEAEPRHEQRKAKNAD